MVRTACSKSGTGRMEVRGGDMYKTASLWTSETVHVGVRGEAGGEPV